MRTYCLHETGNGTCLGEVHYLQMRQFLRQIIACHVTEDGDHALLRILHQLEETQCIISHGGSRKAAGLGTNDQHDSCAVQRGQNGRLTLIQRSCLGTD